MHVRRFAASIDPLDVYIYAFGVESCATRLNLTSVCSAAAPNQAAHGTSGTRHALGAVGFAPAPRAVAPCAFAAFRWALYFVGRILPPRLAPRSTAHSQNRAADVSLKLSAPPPSSLPRLPCGAYLSLLPSPRRVPRHRLDSSLLTTND